MTLVQPMIYYNVPSVPGMAIGYNGAITYDHNISSGDKGGATSETSSRA